MHYSMGSPIIIPKAKFMLVMVLWGLQRERSLKIGKMVKNNEQV